MFHWDDDEDGRWSRMFRGEALGIGVEDNRVDLGVEGVQYSDGTITRSLYVYRQPPS